MASHLGFYPRRPLQSLFARQLRQDGPPSTMIRLLTSNHVKDLQVIALCTIFFWLVAVLTILIYGDTVGKSETKSIALHFFNMDPVRNISETIITNHAMLGGVTAVAGAVLSWVYQTGSKRLGVVDQFACEISAICRTCFVVDLPRITVEMADRPPPSEPRTLSSAEQYTPVCDKALPDLQPLEVTVVDAVTEFYNYRRAMMDYMRAAFAEVKSPDEYRHHIVMMLYMQFLMYESARHAVRELVEFEPNREESLINILCCELSIFKFLRSASDFRDKVTQRPDFRADRLELRTAVYKKVVPKTYCAAKSRRGNEKWQRAYTTAPELMRRYTDVFGDPHESALTLR